MSSPILIFVVDEERDVSKSTDPVMEPPDYIITLLERRLGKTYMEANSKLFQIIHVKLPLQPNSDIPEVIARDRKLLLANVHANRLEWGELRTLSKVGSHGQYYRQAIVSALEKIEDANSFQCIFAGRRLGAAFLIDVLVNGLRKKTSKMMYIHYIHLAECAPDWVFWNSAIPNISGSTFQVVPTCRFSHIMEAGDMNASTFPDPFENMALSVHSNNFEWLDPIIPYILHSLP